MRSKLLALLYILFTITYSCLGQTYPIDSVTLNGADTNRINLVFLADGFQPAQLDTFKSKVKSIQAYIFTQPPLKQYAKFFNVFAIEVPSADSGVGHPGTATDVTEPAFPVSSPNVFFNSTFDNGGVHRAVVAKNSMGVYDVLNKNLPMYDVPMVLANTPEYGGTGGGYLTFTINASANETAVHEIGHTFGKLWDEYWNNMPGEHPNMTQDTNSTTMIWKNWLGTNGINRYKHGATAPESTWYRPHQNCKMRYLGSPFCVVCRENIIDRIYEKVLPIDSFSPSNTSLILTSASASIPFSFSPVLPNPNTVQYKWVLNGNVINATDTFIQVSQSQLVAGENILMIVLTDTTLMSRSYTPAKGYMSSIEWTLWRDGQASITNISANNQFVYKLFPVPATNTLSLYCNNKTSASYLDYEIITIAGSISKKGKITLASGEQTMPLDITGLAAGVGSPGTELEFAL